MNRVKLRNILKALSPMEPDFQSFDNEVQKLKDKLKEQVVVKTLEDVNVALERNRKQINFDPLTQSFAELKQNIETKNTELLATLNSKQDELGNLISENDSKNTDTINALQAEIAILSARKVEIPDFGKQIKDTESKLMALIETAKTIDTLEDEKENEEIQKQFANFETQIKDLKQRFQKLGGGSMNRRISIAGTVISKKYIDINFISGITATDNNTTKQVDLTLTGGGGLTPIVITGTVDGTNVTFTSTQPTYVVSDGVWNRATDSQSSPQTNWTWLAGTLTMTVPPQSDIYGF